MKNYTQEELDHIKKELSQGLNPWGFDQLARVQFYLEVQCGMLDDPEDKKPEWSKLPEEYLCYGDRVKIIWQGSYEGMEDYGYITAIPSYEDSWDMAGLIHIPQPWCEKGGAEPEWITLWELVTNSYVQKIVKL